MINLLKGFGKGILYIIGLPFFLLFLLLYAIYSIFLFLFMVLKAIVLFFTGRSLFEDLPEDRKAKEILNPKPVKPAQEAISEEPKPIESQQPVQKETAPEVTPQYIPPIYPSVFTPEYVPPKDENINNTIEPEPEPEEEIAFDEPEDRPLNNNQEGGFKPNFLEREEPMPIPSNKEEKEKNIGRYTPKTSVFEDFDDDEQESSSGVRVERSGK